MRKSSVMHRSMLAHYPRAVSGEGVYVYDSEGKAYLDACGGAAVCCLGYNNTRIRNALTEQITKLSYIHSGINRKSFKRI